MSSVDEDELREAFVRISEQHQPPLRVSAEDILREGQRMGRRRRQLSVVASGAAVAVVAVAALLVAAGQGTDQGPAVVGPAEPGKSSTTPFSGHTIPATPSPGSSAAAGPSPVPTPPRSWPDLVPTTPGWTGTAPPSAFR